MTGDDVRHVEFRETWRGYQPDEVDRALDRIAGQLDRGERLDLGPPKFASSWRGYARADVKAFLATLWPAR